jgi:cell division septum initiation protein DivIVA
MPTNKLTNEIIIAAIEGFEGQRRRLDAQIAELRQMLDGHPTETAAATKAAPPKRKISAAARRRMAIGQKARWAKIRGESGLSVVATPEPLKRKMSAARKAALLANLKNARIAKAVKKKAA